MNRFDSGMVGRAALPTEAAMKIIGERLSKDNDACSVACAALPACVAFQTQQAKLYCELLRVTTEQSYHPSFDWRTYNKIEFCGEGGPVYLKL